MSKMLGKFSWIETHGWRRRAALKRKQRREQRRREAEAYRQERGEQ